MRLLALALCAALAAPVLAQTASMDVGPQTLDLRYQSGNAEAAPVAFNGTVTSVGFYGSTAAFSGFHGSQASPTSPGATLSASGFDVSVGGNVGLTSFGTTAPGAVYLPIRVQVGTRYLSGDTSADDPGTDTAVLLASLDLGTGLGTAVDIPLGGRSFAETLHAFGTVVVGAGFTGDLAFDLPGGAPDPSAFGMRSATAMVQTEARKLFGSGLGASVGYTFRALQLDSEPIESGSGVFNAFTGSNFRTAETSHLIHVGLIF